MHKLSASSLKRMRNPGGPFPQHPDAEVRVWLRGELEDALGPDARCRELTELCG